MEKLLFFDIDGTLLDSLGNLPESAVTAMRKAQAKGHKMFLCSGRSYNQIPDTLLDFGFDGIVAATGTYVEYEGKQIHHDTYGRDRMQQIIDLFRGTNVGMLFQTRDYCLTARESYEPHFLNAFRDYGIEIDALTDRAPFRKTIYDEAIEDYPENYPNVESIIYLNSPYTVDELKTMVHDGLNVELASFKPQEPYSGEITLGRNTKGSGMQMVLDALGKTKEDIICFGDGPNDFDMFDASGYAVAMGNAMESVKAKADYITDAVEEDGIYHAMAYLNLI